MKALSGFLILGCLLVAGSATAGVGTVTHLSGILSAKGSAGASKVLSVKSEVNEGDLLTTETETYARVKFVDGAEIVLRPGTQLRVAAYSFQEAKPQNDSAFFSLIKGGLRAVTGLLGKRSQDKVGFTTNTATIGIRGTHFGALLCSGDCANVPNASGSAPPDGLHVDVSSGAVVVTNAARHAGPAQVPVRLSSDGPQIVLDIVDDGVGFDIGAVVADPAAGHFGLRLLGDLATEAGARLDVASAPGRGTHWRLVLTPTGGPS